VTWEATMTVFLISAWDIFFIVKDLLPVSWIIKRTWRATFCWIGQSPPSSRSEKKNTFKKGRNFKCFLGPKKECFFLSFSTS
jgi:hypothetical protein